MMHKLRYLLVLILALQYSILLYYVFRAQSASQYIINVTAYVLPKKHVSDNVLCNRSK